MGQPQGPAPARPCRESTGQRHVVTALMSLEGVILQLYDEVLFMVKFSWDLVLED